jgi:phosphohistidine phosphatase SixA
LKLTSEKNLPVNLRFLLLMRHAKREHKEIPTSRPRVHNRFDDMAASLRRIAQMPTQQTISQDRLRDPVEEQTNRVLSNKGREETTGIAKRLREYIRESSDPPKIAGVLVANSNEAMETANVFCRRFETSPPSLRRVVLDQLAPEKACNSIELMAGNAEKFAGNLRTAVFEKAGKMLGEKDNAVLVVGHQPSLSWLADAFVGEAHPLANSEILCLDLKENVPPKLLWSMAFIDHSTLPELREKIKSKMTLANLLSGFITAGIALLLGLLADKDKIQALGVQALVVFLAAGSLLLAVGFYLLTMFSYDSLLMPTRFWAEAPSGLRHRPPWIVARPPSGAHWILYQNMIRVWQFQFMPATFFALSGLFMLWAGIALGPWRISHSCHWQWTAVSRALSVSLPVLVLGGILWAKTKEIVKRGREQRTDFFSCPGLRLKFRYLCGPWLGSED